jgi:hypothetical protein
MYYHSLFSLIKSLIQTVSNWDVLFPLEFIVNGVLLGK